MIRTNRNSNLRFSNLEKIDKIPMNIKKVLGLGFIAALIKCDQIAPSSHVVANCVANSHQPANHPGVYVATPQTPQSTAVTTNAGHVHTPENQPGSQGDGATRIWKDSKGDSEGTYDGKDANGNNHQVHRWKDNKGLGHETDHWTEAADQSVHSCHRWFDEDGNTHEAIHVTKADGSVVSEHFVKDAHGHVAKIDDHASNQAHQAQSQWQQGQHGQGQEGHQGQGLGQGYQGQGQGQQHGVGVSNLLGGASQGTGPTLAVQVVGQQLHTADCVKSNLSSHN